MTSSPGPDNPYRPTAASANAKDEGRFKRPVRLVATTAITAVFMSGFAVRAPFVMKDFRTLFKAFGAGLSPLTNFFLHTPWLWTLAALGSWYICARIWMQAEMTIEDQARWTRIARLNTLAMGILVGLCVYAMYAPMFKLGQVV